jgi:transcriptional regulator with XRE-family HTH domain
MGTETFGHALRRWRTAAGFSLRVLEAKAHYARSYLSDLENGARAPHAELAARLDEALGAGGELMRLADDPQVPPAENEFQVVRSVQFDMYAYADPTVGLIFSGAGGMEGMKRRTFLGLSGMAGLGMAAPGLVLEAVRHGLTGSLAEERAAVAVDEWQEIVAEYGYSYLSSPPGQLIEGLAVDMLGIQYAIGQQQDSRALRDLRRVGAFLAVFMAMTVANVGELRHAQRWWRSARRVADESGDLHTILWVRGREVVRAMYEERPTARVIQLAEEAEALVTKNAPVSVLPELFSGKAQALALAGRRDEAVTTLRYVQEAIYSELPSSVTSDRDSLFGWAEDRLRFTESFVYSHLGDVDKADEAQRRAIPLYPVSYQRGPAQIELQRALCLVGSGDVVTGIRHAQTTMVALAPEHYIRPVVDLGHKVLGAVPLSDRSRRVVSEFRDYLALPVAR